MRARPVCSVLAAVLAVALPAVALAKPHPQQVCGIVVAIPCKPTDPAVVTLLAQPGIAVDVEAETDADAAALRTAAGDLFFQQACVTGTQISKQNEERAGRLGWAAAAGMTANGPAPPDWLPTDLHSACEAGVTPPGPARHAVQADIRAAVENGIHGKAIFQVIVGTDGSIEKLRLLKSLDVMHGVDGKAEQYIRGTTFPPATKAGVPVRFLMPYVFEVSLR